MLLWLRTFHTRVTIGGSEDVLDRELQWSELSPPVKLEWTLLGAREWLILESTSSASLVVDRGASVIWLRFFSVVAVVERLVGGTFHPPPPTGCMVELGT